jgi:uncharacterized membrane-anchored protein
MAQLALEDHPSRYALVNELHARPFPELTAPCRAVYLALKEPQNAAERDKTRDFAHLIALLDRYGAAHPAPGASHYSGPLGRHFLKWEMHTEFVTYTLFGDDMAERPFSGEMFRLFPEDWLRAAPGRVVTSAIVRVDQAASDAVGRMIEEEVPRWFVPESLAVARVLDGDAVVASDFRLDENGHSRIAVLAQPGIGARRLGRIVQRLLEIETYKAMAMLTLPQARMVATAVARLDRELSDIVAAMAAGGGAEAETLDQLLKMAAEIEYLSSTTAFRFGAAEAYEAIVTQRIEVMREERIGGRQIFAEFMMRRFDPGDADLPLGQGAARRAVGAGGAGGEPAPDAGRCRKPGGEPGDAEGDGPAGRAAAEAAGDGRGPVGRGDQLLRGAARHRLCRPMLEPLGIGRNAVLAVLTLPIVLLVWYFVRRIRRRIAEREGPAS